MKRNVYPELSNNVFSRWKKTVTNMIVVYRLDPYRLNEPPIDFVLQGNEIIELYSEREHQAFLSLNRLFIEAGILVPADTKLNEVDMTNALSDDELRGWLTLKQSAFQQKLRQVTKVTAMRLREMVSEDTPVWMVNALDRRINDGD